MNTCMKCGTQPVESSHDCAPESWSREVLVDEYEREAALRASAESNLAYYRALPEARLRRWLKRMEYRLAAWRYSREKPKRMPPESYIPAPWKKEA